MQNPERIPVTSDSAAAIASNPAPLVVALDYASTNLREVLAFKLGAEENGIDVQRAQEIRSYQAPWRFANAPPFIKGIVNLR